MNHPFHYSSYYLDSWYLHARNLGKEIQGHQTVVVYASNKNANLNLMYPKTAQIIPYVLSFVDGHAKSARIWIVSCTHFNQFPKLIFFRFHVDKLSSAHVYLRLQKGQTIESITPELLEDCAQLVKANSIQGEQAQSILRCSMEVSTGCVIR
jgi:hypothetical protein